MFFSGWTPGQVIWWIVIGVACFGVGVVIGILLILSLTGMSL